MGADRVIFGSDWPHIEGMPRPLDYAVELKEFDDDDAAADHARQRARAEHAPARLIGRTGEVRRRRHRPRCTSSSSTSAAARTRARSSSRSSRPKTASVPWLASQYRPRAPSTRSRRVRRRRRRGHRGDPGDRAEIGIAAMRAGKDVLADKPGATSAEQLDALRAAHAETGKQYLVAVRRAARRTRRWCAAYDLVQAGRIGVVVHTVGLGPHTLNLKHRPEWFFDPARYGGILVDIGSHQVDQFLAFTGRDRREVLASTVRAHAEHPGVQVLGEMLLATDGATGYARVDYFTPAGLAPRGATCASPSSAPRATSKCATSTRPCSSSTASSARPSTAPSEPAGWGDRYLAGTLDRPRTTSSRSPRSAWPRSPRPATCRIARSRERRRSCTSTGDQGRRPRLRLDGCPD